jgi:hypothetical protein
MHSPLARRAGLAEVAAMTRRLSAFAVCAGALFLSLAASGADAQILLRGRGRGVVINVPGANVQIGGVGVPYGYGYGVAPRLIVVPRLGVRSFIDGAALGPLPLTRFAARPSIPAAYSDPASLPTEGELRAMSDSDLLNTVAALATRLDADLERFTSAATWQNYLRLPEDALPPPNNDNRVVLGMASLSGTLSRFESAVVNPEYVQITGLPSYAAMHSALKEVVRRFANGEQPAAIAQGSPATVETPAASTALSVPQVPRPDSPLARTERPQLQTPNIEMQNLQSGRTQTVTASAEKTTTSKPATTVNKAATTAEELPNPPPSLVAPKNAASEHSILSK